VKKEWNLTVLVCAYLIIPFAFTIPISSSHSYMIGAARIFSLPPSYCTTLIEVEVEGGGIFLSVDSILSACYLLLLMVFTSRNFFSFLLVATTTDIDGNDDTTTTTTTIIVILVVVVVIMPAIPIGSTRLTHVVLSISMHKEDDTYMVD